MEEKEIILGRNPVLEYLKGAGSGKGLRLIISEKAHGKIIGEIRTAAKSLGVPIQFEGRDYFASMGKSSTHQGTALIRKAHRSDTERTNIIETALKQKGIIVLLDHLTDPHNVGSIIRTAEAFGAAGIVVPGTRAAGITPAVIKASAGATAHIPVETVANIASWLDSAKSSGLWIIGTSDRGKASIEKARNMKPAVLVIGSEGDGMKRLTEDKCDLIISFDMKGRISSLNASVAAGIAIYELLKD